MDLDLGLFIGNKCISIILTLAVDFFHFADADLGIIMFFDNIVLRINQVVVFSFLILHVVVATATCVVLNVG